MKRNPITWITGGVLVVIFVLMLFTFQVRQTEIAVVTTFGKYSRSITEPGFQTRLPWPIQKVYTFDNRIQVSGNQFGQTITRDQINLLATVYVGWRVVDPQLFLVSLGGDALKAEQNLEKTVLAKQYETIAKHDFSELVSTNRQELKFDLIEKEIVDGISNTVRTAYGIQICFAGIKQLGLPESISSKVFDRMKSERLALIKKYQAEGEKDAQGIRSDADLQANIILADAQAKAIKIVSDADAQVSEYYKVMQQNPELAKFLFQRKALENSLSNRTTLIIDQQTPPFNLMRQAVGGGK
jgi:modulator of FtsH protease HflC